MINASKSPNGLMFLWKHMEIQIYIVIMCSVVLRKQVADLDNLLEKKKTGNIQNGGKQLYFIHVE